MKTILVTGGSGLVGQNLKEVVENNPLYNSKYKFVWISSKDYNLLSLPETEIMMTMHRPSIVIHLAAKVGGLYDNMAHNATFLRDNLLLNLNVFEACRKFNVDKVVSCLSTCIFPDNIQIPITETDLHKGPPHSSNYGYSYAKRLLDTMSQAYNQEFGTTKFVTVVPTNIFGKYDNFHLEKGHVVPALIHKCYLSKKNGIDLEIKGDGSALRQFIYAKDLAKLIMLVTEHYTENEPIILSPSEEYSIRQIVDLIVEGSSFEGNVVYEKLFCNGQHRKTVSNDKLKLHFPEFTFTDLSLGLQETIDWFFQEMSKDTSTLRI
jgi:GDP-L-fucose synthase